MKKIWLFIHENLIRKQRVYLLIVIENQGSSPGQPGFKMAVTEDGRLKGSVGGGQSEYQMVEMTKKELAKEKPEIFFKHEIHKDDATTDKSGMICSGEQWVAFYPLDENDLPLVSNIKNAIETGEKGLLHFSQDGISFNKGNRVRHQHKNPVTSPTEWEYFEETGNANKLYIFGAGHVGLALSQIMSHLEFVIHIFDNREGLATLSDNTFANHSEIINYKNVAHLVDDDPNSYVVIMTFGHKSDEVVLRQMIDKNLRYLGMMGSDKKVASIFENLKNEGFSDKFLQKVNAPIGLPIESQTPFEIAISIAGQIIVVKNNEK